LGGFFTIDAIKLIPLLVQTWYLTIKDCWEKEEYEPLMQENMPAQHYSLTYANKEIKKSFLNLVAVEVLGAQKIFYQQQQYIFTKH
jgi:hypothetical protein